MNYQHFYHAGGHADVFKHLVLCCLLAHFNQKQKPFCYIDTHAGSGEYSLIDEKNVDYLNGINLLKQRLNNINNDLIKHYYTLQANFHHFKGSPLIAQTYLREQDEMLLIEKALSPYQQLKKVVGNDKRVHLHHIDAQVALKGLLPPKIKRGLVLIDPIYEQPNEHELWLQTIELGLKKFPTACYALWFPIKSKNTLQYFYNKIKKSFLSVPKIILEFCPLPTDVHLRLNGSGMLVIQPPYQFEQHIKPPLNDLLQLLKQHPTATVSIYNV